MSDTATTSRSTLLRSLLYYLITGLFVSGLAVVNRYPLVYSDTGAYINNCFMLEQNDDRPIGYGLIMRAVSWQGTLWTVVVFQGMVASWLLMLLVREVVPGAQQRVRTHLVLLALLLLCSSLPWYSAQIMADIFTPLVLLIVFLLFRAKLLGPWREGALWVLLFFFLAAHNAHLPMAGVLSLLLLITALRKGGAWRSRAFRMRWLGLNATIGGAALMIMLFNNAKHGHMQLSRAGSLFLAGRLCEPGIMADHLQRTCPDPTNPLCPFKDDMPIDASSMLWQPEGLPSRLGLTLGEADSLLAPVVADVLSQPEYLLRFARSALVSTVVQSCQYDVASGLFAYGEDSGPYAHLRKRMTDEHYSFNHTRQQWNGWADVEEVNRRVGITLLLSLLVLGLFWTRPRTGADVLLAKLARWALLWIVLNAAITSTFAGVDARMQSRVLWLLTMVAFFILANRAASWPVLSRLGGSRNGPAPSE